MFKVLPLLARAGLALFLISELLASPGPRASAPYFENFDSYPNSGVPANFIGSAGDNWGITNPTGTSGSYVSRPFSTPTPDYAYSVINLANVAGRDFTVSTRFTAAVTGHGPILDASVGLIALSSNDPSVFPTECYTLEYFVASGTGRRGTLAPRGGGALWQGNGFATIFDVGQGLIMSLHGEYAGGTLFLTATISNGIGAIVFHGTDTSPPNGPYFGYWDRVSGSVTAFAQLTASYDDFAVTFTTASARFGNISTRMNVGSGDNAAIGGFIITGTSPKRILIRGVRPSVSGALPGVLEDPTLEFHGPNGAVLATNDNWKDTQQAEIEQTGLQPSNNLDSAIITTVAPGAYTAILRGKTNSTGLGLVETYDLTPAEESTLGNFSTRGVVGRDDDVMIGGVVVSGGTLAPVLVRALGPSLQNFGLDSLADPMLELHDRNGALLASNDNWRSSQDSEIAATGLAPGSVYEPAIIAYLFPTNYTAIVRGKDNTTGVALVELYQLP
jgi:hypothetical protein